MKRRFHRARLLAAAFTTLLGSGYLDAAAERKQAEVADVGRLLETAREAAVHVPSLFLSGQEKLETVEAFVKIIETKKEGHDIEPATNRLSRSALREFTMEEYLPAWREIDGLNGATEEIRTILRALVATLSSQPVPALGCQAARCPMAALAVWALVKGKAHFGRAASGQQTEHPPWTRSQFQLGKHRASESAKDAAQSAKDTWTVLC